MNCLDFRRGVLADPRRPGDPALAHASGCKSCREFLDRQRELDAELYEAMRVPPPDGLADRILVAQGVRRSRRPWLWGLAATVVLAAGLAALAPSWHSGDALGREAIAHVAHEPQSFRIRTRTEAGFLPAALSGQGFRLAAAVGEVTYAVFCPMDGRLARHLVVATAGGPVTMFLMPDDPERRSRAVTENGGMTAVTLPARKGTVVIVAPRREDALALERMLAEA